MMRKMSFSLKQLFFVLTIAALVISVSLKTFWKPYTMQTAISLLKEHGFLYKESKNNIMLSVVADSKVFSEMDSVFKSLDKPLIISLECDKNCTVDKEKILLSVLENARVVELTQLDVDLLTQCIVNDPILYKSKSVHVLGDASNYDAVNPALISGVHDLVLHSSFSNTETLVRLLSAMNGASITFPGDMLSIDEIVHIVNLNKNNTYTITYVSQSDIDSAKKALLAIRPELSAIIKFDSSLK